MPELLHETQTLIAYQGDVAGASEYLKISPTVLTVRVLSDPRWLELLQGTLAIGALEIFSACKTNLLQRVDELPAPMVMQLQQQMMDFVQRLSHADAEGKGSGAVNIQVNYGDENGRRTAGYG